ncbi:unnamed protein product [Protopolystoma xenopodis]|uniref:Uncharacterized protein n=1 Tax=Protopolystoma xenopodis TaxID=117903 RepID=A0A3S5C2U4_9PLAT|nr:unnamed protein product [Protopolystoma xenopodis]
MYVSNLSVIAEYAGMTANSSAFCHNDMRFYLTIEPSLDCRGVARGQLKRKSSELVFFLFA